jgi:hypothetical protein
MMRRKALKSMKQKGFQPAKATTGLLAASGGNG